VSHSPEHGSIDAPFFDTNKPELHQVLQLLGHSDDWRDDLPGMEAYMQREWVPGDHHNPVNQEPFSEAQQAQAREIFDKMGMVAEIRPPGGEFDQIIILGAMMRANNARTEFAADLLNTGDISLAEGGKIVFWGGPRQRGKKEEGPLTDFIEKVTAPGHHAAHDPWLQRQLDKTDPASAEKAFNTETDEGRALLLHYMGDMTLSKAHIPLAASTDKLPPPERARDFTHYEFTQPRTGLNLEVINAQIVDRPMGDPRHTTEQCAIEWLEHSAPEQGGRILFVTSNPYVRRTTLVVQKLIDQAGRDDLQLIGCGPAAYEDSNVQLFMGEIGRLLYEDLQAAQS
jgi:hypothetical protein